MYSDKISQAQGVVAKIRPAVAEDRPIYEAILRFYSDNALIETFIDDLKILLGNKKIRVFKASAQTFKDCVYSLLDEFPEIASSKGMLRYYETGPGFNWQECEKAEIAFGEALSQDTYGWQPDFWTIFEREPSETEPACRLTLIVGF